MNIVSWNINGMKGKEDKNRKQLERLISSTQADLYCLQETRSRKRSAYQIAPEYQVVMKSPPEGKYNGMAVYSNQVVMNDITDLMIGNKEGRVIVMEHEKFYLINIYLPNLGDCCGNKVYKEGWFRWLIETAVNLNSIKPTILCGDFNIAVWFNGEKDRLWTNAGFSPDEQKMFGQLLTAGFTDVLSYKYTEEQIINYLDEKWGYDEISSSYRLDFIFVSNCLRNRISSFDILTEYPRFDKNDKLSTHFPLQMEIDI